MILQLFATILGILLLAIPMLYLILSLIGMLIPVMSRYQMQSDRIRIFLKSDGIHTDFILPMKNEIFDWRTKINKTLFDIELEPDTMLEVGWGEQGFYFEIPTWADLTPRIAFKAMCVPSTSLFHVKAYNEFPESFKFLQTVYIDSIQYEKLVQYILKGFEQENGELIHIEGRSYTENDVFYRSPYKYHALNNCNVWVIKGLRHIGLRTALWSPIAHAIFRHLRRDKSLILEPIVQ